MTLGNYRKPDYVYFMGEDGKHHSKGTIVCGWSSGDYLQPPEEDVMTKLEDIDPILLFVRDHFHPKAWEIKDGVVVGVEDES